MVMEEDSAAGNSPNLQGMCCLTPVKLSRSLERPTGQASSTPDIGSLKITRRDTSTQPLQVARGRGLDPNCSKS